MEPRSDETTLQGFKNPHQQQKSERAIHGSSAFWCDLVQNFLHYRSFLTKIHEIGVTSVPLPYESLRRYRDLWLPLVRQNPYSGLIPPPDIAWLWHCHRLKPREYIGYTVEQSRTGSILEARSPFALQTVEDQSHDSSPSLVTRLLWKLDYKNEPFFLPQHINAHTSYRKVDRLIGGFDLLEATKHQATFLWQIKVYDERFGDMGCFKQGRDNYFKFLKLSRKAAARGLIMVPTFQIELMWRTHILSSITKYHADCKAMVGTSLLYDDSQIERASGDIKDVWFRRTERLWMEEYGENYDVQEGTYRGEPLSSVTQSWAVQVEGIGASSTFPTTVKNWKVKPSGRFPLPSDVRAFCEKDGGEGREQKRGTGVAHGAKVYRLETTDENDHIEKRFDGRHGRKVEESQVKQDHLRERPRAKSPTGDVRATVKDPKWDAGSTPFCVESAWLVPFMWNGYDCLCCGADAGSSGAWGDAACGCGERFCGCGEGCEVICEPGGCELACCDGCDVGAGCADCGGC
jgi:hypothetical protein